MAKAPKKAKKWLATVDPQTPMGSRFPQDLGRADSSVFGGQVALIMGRNTALPIAMPGWRCSVESQRIATHPHSKRQFDASYGQAQEKMPVDKPRTQKATEINRHWLSENDAGNEFIDKEDTKEQKIGDKRLLQNIFYSQMPVFGRHVAASYIKQKEYPNLITSEYWAAALATQHMLHHLAASGAKERPVLSFQPHSLRFRKMTGDIQDKIDSGKIKSKKGFERYVQKLCKDHRELAMGLYVERRFMAEMADLIVVNSENEKFNQLSAAAYQMPFEDLPTVDLDKIKIVYPAINGRFFCLKPSKEQASYGKEAGKLLQEAIESGISPANRKKKIICIVGRLNKDKNHTAWAKAYRDSSQLRDNFNLLFVIQGPHPNAIATMQQAMKEAQQVNSEIQKLLKQLQETAIRSELLTQLQTLSSSLNKVEITGFVGQKAEELRTLAKILQGQEFACLALPDQRLLAAAYRYLLAEGKRDDGLTGLPIGSQHSLEEPYGLTVIEQATIMPVVVSDTGGNAPELIEAGAPSFDPYPDSRRADQPYWQMTKAAMKLARDKNYFATAESLREFAREKTWEAVTPKYLQLHTDLESELGERPLDPEQLLLIDMQNEAQRAQAERLLVASLTEHFASFLRKTKAKAQVKF